MPHPFSVSLKSSADKSSNPKASFVPLGLSVGSSYSKTLKATFKQMATRSTITLRPRKISPSWAVWPIAGVNSIPDHVGIVNDKKRAAYAIELIQGFYAIELGAREEGLTYE